ncbi:Reverse transcriptase, RNA-dependent DNA polymerase [Cucumis melo var. makuwa]|uniref:Reverse transcriptase, RNA-dependent DNA polymerase n=1 Tax=Cucumis melo var. makuwa TaxID=1194695 RepID=A0A5D3C525_CUCMM|nr:Reverse transcriptase, RNA-dependent DNA polymerase [Cucumis melo var. makuwa]
MMLINATLFPEALAYIVGCTFAYEKSEESIDPYVKRIKEIKDTLANVLTLDDEDLLSYTLNRLSNEYNTFHMSMRTSNQNNHSSPWLVDSGCCNVDVITSDFQNLFIVSEDNGEENIIDGIGHNLPISHTSNDITTSHILHQGPSVDGLYPLMPLKSNPTAHVGIKSPSTSFSLWHKRAKLFTSRHVIFNKSTFPYSTLTSNSPPSSIRPSTSTSTNSTSFTPFLPVLINSNSMIPYSTKPSNEILEASVSINLDVNDTTSVNFVQSDDRNTTTNIEHIESLANNITVNNHSLQTGSKSSNTKKKVFVATTFVSNNLVDSEFSSYTQASKHLVRQSVMQKEYNALMKQSTWVLTPLPPGLVAKGYHQEAADSSFFIRRHNSSITYLLLYVDDIIVTVFLGLEIVNTQADISVTQTKYARDVIKHFGMTCCKPFNTPIALSFSLMIVLKPVVLMIAKLIEQRLEPFSIRLSLYRI